MTAAPDRSGGLERRTGIGYDAHRFGGLRKLVLGGVEIPGESGLIGHSDADIVCHALMDALLGAAGMGDLGDLFPDDDSRYSGADSVELMGCVVALIGEAGWHVANADVTVIAERPRIAPFKGDMSKRLSQALAVEAGAVSVKATTNEGMGFIGRAEGIAALAVAQIERGAERR